MLAAAHLHPTFTIPAALAVTGWVLWYWFRLGDTEIPPSRRKIRRDSLFTMVISLPMFVRALSFLDPRLEQSEYVRTWLLALLMVLVVIATALLDALNNLRLHQSQHHQTIREAAKEMARQLAARRPTQPTLPCRNSDSARDIQDSQS